MFEPSRGVHDCIPNKLGVNCRVYVDFIYTRAVPVLRTVEVFWRAIIFFVSLTSQSVVWLLPRSSALNAPTHIPHSGGTYSQRRSVTNCIFLTDFFWTLTWIKIALRLQYNAAWERGVALSGFGSREVNYNLPLYKNSAIVVLTCPTQMTFIHVPPVSSSNLSQYFTFRLVSRSYFHHLA